MDWKDNFPKENRYFETEKGILYCGDCLEIMKEFPKESIDLILTDPPYLINYKTNYRKDKTHRFCKPIQNDDNKQLIKDVVKLIYDKLKNNKAFYCFSSWKTVDFFKQQIEKYFMLKNIVVWVKNNWTAGDLKAQYGQMYELIFYANKGRAFIKGERNPDVWFFDRVAGKQQVHQNQKPLKLLEFILEKHSKDFDLVLDPFIGSGTTAIVAERLNRKWIGIELEEKYCEITKKRVLELKKKLF